MAPEPEAGGGGASDAAEVWGDGGLVGDGRYRMTHRLGRGGMAEVFAAEDVRLGRTVAVKLLRPDLAEDPVSKARFTREAQSVAGLNHHAVVAVYDSGEDVVNGQVVPYIVMELVEGRTIRELLVSAEAPPPEQALIIVSGVLEALAYSHQHGIVHRDIKPANVIITHGGAVKVMDFGIARALHGAQSTMTQTGMVMGTPQYLSPEQALGKAVDHRSDLYATGCLLYELLAMRPPFVGETPLSVVYQHVQDIPVPPSEVSDAAPPELDGLVMRSLAKEPDDRFQSAEEMRGLIQYGLQMLQQQGGHTGTWNTGHVAAHGGATAAMGMASTTAMGLPPHGDTAQRPLLPPMNPNDGGYDGGGQGSSGGQGSGRGKMWLFLALALVAIVAGAAFAVHSINPPKEDAKSHDTPPAPTPSVSQTKSAPPDDTSGDTGESQDSSAGQAPIDPPPPEEHHDQRPDSSGVEPTESPSATDPSADTDTTGGETDTGGDTGGEQGKPTTTPPSDPGDTAGETDPVGGDPGGVETGGGDGDGDGGGAPPGGDPGGENGTAGLTPN